MIGSGFKKFAAENGLQVDAGIGYGVLRGYQVSLNEGSGFKQMIITTHFPDGEKLNAMLSAMNAVDFQREYRVQQLNFTPNGIAVVFTDTVGTLKKIAAFVDWFFPLLEVGGAVGADICPDCHMEMGGTGIWKKVDGIGRCYHSACAEKLSRTLDAENTAAKEADTGTYTRGALGALLGALIGGVVWGIVLYSGWMVSAVGLLIAFVAERGYTWFRGRAGKGKIGILIASVVLGVIFGTGLYLVLEVVNALNDLLGTWSFADLTEVLGIMLENDEVVGELLTNFFGGLAFACLGSAAFLLRSAKAVQGRKVVDLK